jgi:hypothetical protein
MNNEFEIAVTHLREESSSEVDSGKKMQDVLRLLLHVDDSARIRAFIRGFEEDWSISPKIRLAMFFQIFRNSGATADDFRSFSVFLNLFYEEMDDWSNALVEYADSLK